MKWSLSWEELLENRMHMAFSVSVRKWVVCRPTGPTSAPAAFAPLADASPVSVTSYQPRYINAYSQYRFGK